MWQSLCRKSAQSEATREFYASIMGIELPVPAGKEVFSLVSAGLGPIRVRGHGLLPELDA